MMCSDERLGVHAYATLMLQHRLEYKQLCTASDSNHAHVTGIRLPSTTDSNKTYSEVSEPAALALD